MKKLIYLTILLLSYSSCYEDFDNTSQEEIPTAGPKIYGATQVSGLVSQENQNPVTVVINNNRFELEESLFTANLNRASLQGQIILVEQEEKLVGAAQIPLIANDYNYTSIKAHELHEIAINQNVDIDLATNATISIEQASFANASNQEVTGSTSLFTLSIEDTESLAQLSNHAIATDGSYDVLSPSRAYILNYINDGQQVYPIGGLALDFNLLKQESIYYLDEADSRWKPWSSETADQLQYRVIMIAEAMDANYINGSVRYLEDPVKHQKLAFSGPAKHTIYSSASGKWANFASNQEIQEVISLDPCDNILQEQEITTTEENQIVLETTEDAFFENNFEIIDCDGQLVSKAIIRLQNDQQVYFIAQSSGEGSSWLPICPDKAINLSVKEQTDINFGPSINWLEKPSNIGVLSICEDHQDGFAFIQIRGDRKVYTSIALAQMPSTMVSVLSSQALELVIDGIDKEVYLNDQVNIAINDPDFGTQGYAVSCLNSMQGCGISFCEISHDLNSGDEWSRIFFEGNIWMQTISPPTAGSFDIRGIIQQK